MIFAYIRVSSKDQNIERQQDAINTYAQNHGIVVDRIFTDMQSGKDFEREQYQALKICLRQGNVLIIKELDRLGRNMEQVKEEWQQLEKAGVEIIVIDTPILNTTSKSDLEKKLISNIVFELLAYMGEKEREKIKQRQSEGISAAKARGKYLGRPKIEKPVEWDIVYHQWTIGEITAVKAMKVLNLKRCTFYKFIKEEKEKDAKL